MKVYHSVSFLFLAEYLLSLLFPSVTQIVNLTRIQTQSLDSSYYISAQGGNICTY